MDVSFGSAAPAATLEDVQAAWSAFLNGWLPKWTHAVSLSDSSAAAAAAAAATTVTATTAAAGADAATETAIVSGARAAGVQASGVGSGPADTETSIDTRQSLETALKPQLIALAGGICIPGELDDDRMALLSKIIAEFLKGCAGSAVTNSTTCGAAPEQPNAGLAPPPLPATADARADLYNKYLAVAISFYWTCITGQGSTEADNRGWGGEWRRKGGGGGRRGGRHSRDKEKARALKLLKRCLSDALLQIVEDQQHSPLPAQRSTNTLTLDPVQMLHGVDMSEAGAPELLLLISDCPPSVSLCLRPHKASDVDDSFVRGFFFCGLTRGH